jgi:hypothetical protein
MTRGSFGAGAGSDAGVELVWCWGGVKELGEAGRNWSVAGAAMRSGAIGVSGAGAAIRSGATGGAGAGAAIRSGDIGGAGAGEARLVLVLDGRVLFCVGAVAGARAALVRCWGVMTRCGANAVLTGFLWCFGSDEK